MTIKVTNIISFTGKQQKNTKKSRFTQAEKKEDW